MDADMRLAIEGILLGLRHAGVITEDHLPHIVAGICEAGKKGRSGTAWRCTDLAAQLSKSFAEDRAH